MRYNVHIIDESAKHGGHDLFAENYDSAREALEAAKNPSMEREGRVGRVDTRDWEITELSDGCGVLQPTNGDGRFCVVADPIEEIVQP